MAINPIAKEVSWILYPNAPATGAAYLKVSPIIPTLVFALLLAAANTSLNIPASLAFNPNPVNASVTISEVVPRSSLDAIAKFSIGSIPSSISPVFQPAIAIYCIPSPACAALNLVLAPISWALFSNFLRSSPVAPEIAATLSIWASYSIPTWAAATPIPVKGKLTWVVSFPPISWALLPTFLKLFPKSSSLLDALLTLWVFSTSLLNLFTADWALFTSSSALFIWVS